MKYLAGQKVTAIVENLIDAGVQGHDYESDLTVGQVSRPAGPGSVDFGGSEASVAALEPIAPERSAAEEHGWWVLAPGAYLIRFNEVPQLGINQIAFIQPHERLVRAGAMHPSFYFRATREHLDTMLLVGGGGIRIKENARVSKLLVLELEG